MNSIFTTKKRQQMFCNYRIAIVTIILLLGFRKTMNNFNILVGSEL